MFRDSRLEPDPTATCIRAVQGHTMPRFRIDKLYTEITSLGQFDTDPTWNDEPPDHLLVELNSESDLRLWARLQTSAHSKRERWHSMRAVHGTGPQNIGSKNIALYAFLDVKRMLDLDPKIKIYKTSGGRIVTSHNLPASLVVMARTVSGDEIRDPMQVPAPPLAPAGQPRVRKGRPRKHASSCRRCSYGD